jgi:AcrR family transcriptional regulator
MASYSTARKLYAEPEAPSAKHEAILTAATRVFLDAGYGAASMDAIARVAGVSKQTIYAHFGGKAALFEATVLKRSDRLLEPVPTANDAVDDPEEALRAIARGYLELILSPETLARFRVVMAESGRFPELAEVFYRSGPARATDGLADYLARLDGQGILEIKDPRLAADQFYGMVRGDFFVRHLLGIGELMTAQERDRIVRAAVNRFVGGCRRD